MKYFRARERSPSLTPSPYGTPPDTKRGRTWRQKRAHQQAPREQRHSSSHPPSSSPSPDLRLQSRLHDFPTFEKFLQVEALPHCRADADDERANAEPGHTRVRRLVEVPHL